MEGVGVLVQEFIEGKGHGLFALMDHGRPLRLFMHERLREFPPTGGPSTAAAAFYSPRLEELGVKLLSALEWNGVAMVEFKFDLRRQDFVLMEVNGKFWGSLELALRAGVNFGRDLIHLYRNEPLDSRSSYDHKVKFYWPLDGDLRTLWCKRQVIRGIGDYFRPNAATNLGQSAVADLKKSVRLIRDVVNGYSS
jgi:predicted ATP-grasp superfamily ATP-dependent carboligase